jgi:hypothetical protein
MLQTHPRKPRFRLLPPLFLALAGMTTAQASTPWTVGTAFRTTDGAVAYRELHYPAPDRPGLSSRVEYQDASGRTIVSKSLDFSRSITAPAIDQVDQRTGTRVFTRHEDGRLQAGYQRNADADLRTDTVRLTPDLIVDAGFDPFVRTQWQQLLAGDSVKASFFVPSRLDTVTVSIAPVAREECAEAPGEVLCLVVRPAGMLRVVGWFVEPLRLAYDIEQQRLQMFRGLSNLLDNEGNPQDVVVLFEYDVAPASAAVALTPPAAVW